jgi:hypothetical protein
MQLPITPENFAAVLIAAGTGASAVLTAIGGMALWKKRSEPPPPGSPDALTVSLVENTKAMGEMNKAMNQMTGQFGDNLRMFTATVQQLQAIAEDIEETRRAAEASRDHLAAIRDATNRRSR